MLEWVGLTALEVYTNHRQPFAVVDCHTLSRDGDGGVKGLSWSRRKLACPQETKEACATGRPQHHVVWLLTMGRPLRLETMQ